MRTICKAALLATAAMVLGASPALAQSGSDEAAASSADIIVTARRTEERLQDVPISITVYSQEQLNSRNIFTAADLGAYTPSLSTNSRYGPDKASFAIRGFVQDLNTAPSVGVYFAEVVGARAADPTGGGDGVGAGQLFDLQNVQVLKGPQGTLFGRNTTGGAVLLVPRRPSDMLEGYVEGSVGNYDLRRGQAVLNLPLANTLKVRLGVDRMKRDGYEVNRTRDRNGAPSHFADVDFVAARLSILANLTPDLENYTIASYARSDTNGVVGRLVGCASAQDVANAPATIRPRYSIGFLYGCGQIARQNARGDGFRDVESSNADAALKVNQWQAINTTTWQASDSLTVKNIISYAEYRVVDRFSVGGDNFLNPNTVAATRPDFNLIYIANTPGYDNTAQSTFTEELQFQGRTSDNRLTWQAGGYLEISNPLGTSSQLVISILNCPNAYALQCAGQGAIANSFLQTWYRNKGLYAQGTYQLTDQLSTTAGLRYTWDTARQYFAATSITFPAPFQPRAACSSPRLAAALVLPGAIAPGQYQACGLTFEENSKRPTWVIDLDYKPSQDVMLYAKWARGYRAGGVNASIPYFETWNPEKVDTYEIGAKTSFRGAVSGYFNVTGFYNDFRQQQVQAGLITANPARFTGGSAVVNAGKSRIWGIEVDASATLLRDLRLDLGYTYLNTKLLSALDPAVPAEAACCIAAAHPTAVINGPLALSPKHRLTATAIYTLPIEEQGIGRISLSATYTYTDRQVASTATRPELQVLPSTSLVNLNVNWTDFLGLPVDLTAFVTNLTKEDFPLNITNTYSGFGFESYIPNEPRMYGARLKVRF